MLVKNKMIYKYLLEKENGQMFSISSEDHYLSSKEIAILFGILNSRSQKYYASMIKNIKNNYPRYFYKTRFGPMRVFSPEDIAEIAKYIINNSVEIDNNYTLGKYKYTLDDKGILCEYIRGGKID